MNQNSFFNKQRTKSSFTEDIISFAEKSLGFPSISVNEVRVTEICILFPFCLNLNLGNPFLISLNKSFIYHIKNQGLNIFVYRKDRKR